MARKAGFTIKSVTKRNVGSRVDVYFKRFNGKIVKCWVHDHLLMKTFVGLAKCHPNDTFTEGAGMNMAFERAMEKRNRASHKEAADAIRYAKFIVDQVGHDVSNKYARMRQKGKLVCDPHAQAV